MARKHKAAAQTQEAGLWENPEPQDSRWARSGHRVDTEWTRSELGGTAGPSSKHTHRIHAHPSCLFEDVCRGSERRPKGPRKPANSSDPGTTEWANELRVEKQTPQNTEGGDRQDTHSPTKSQNH